MSPGASLWSLNFMNILFQLKLLSTLMKWNKVCKLQNVKTTDGSIKETDGRPSTVCTPISATDCISSATAKIIVEVHCKPRPVNSIEAIGRCDMPFPVSDTTVWNDLPLHVAFAPSLVLFRQRLKTFLFFSRSYQDTIIWLSCVTITIHHYCLDTCGPCIN